MRNQKDNYKDIVISPEVREYIQAAEIVSLGKLFPLLKVDPTDMQNKLIDLFDNKLKEWNFLTLVASRRSGKSFSMAILVVRELLIPHSSTIMISTSAKSLSNLFNEILRLLRILGIKTSAINSQNYYIRIGDSHFRAAFPKSVEGVVGNKASLLCFDEAGLYQYQDFADRLLLPMRLDYKTYPDTLRFVSKVVLISSPRAIGSDFYITYNKGLRPLKERHKYPKNDNYISPDGYTSLHYSIYDSPLVSPEMIESIKESNTDEVWKTEYLAQFIPATQGSVFKFNDDNIYNQQELFDSIKNMENKSTLQGFIGCDIGIRDNSAIVVATVFDNKLYILDGFEKGMLTTEQLAKQIQQMKNHWINHPILPLDFEEGATYIDPSALTVRHDLANIYDIENLPAYNKIKAGIDSINTLFEHKLLMIPDNMDNLIIQAQELSYTESAIGSINSGHHDPFVRVKGHHYDLVHAFRYCVASMYRYWGLPEVQYNYDNTDYSTKET